MPYVNRSKFWNFVAGVLHSSCALLFLLKSVRVCSGWYLLYDNIEDFEDGINYDNYLLVRGGQLICASIFGICNIIGFAFAGHLAHN